MKIQPVNPFTNKLILDNDAPKLAVIQKGLEPKKFNVEPELDLLVIRHLLKNPTVKEEILSGRVLGVFSDNELDRLNGNIEAILFHREQLAIQENNRRIAKQAFGLTDQDSE